MTEDLARSDEQPQPNLVLRALDIMVGVWDLTGRDFTSNAEIRGQSTFEWLEGGFFLVHRFSFDYAGRKFTGVEYIGYDQKSGHLKTHVFSNDGPESLEYTWEVTEETFTNWYGNVGSDNHYTGKFSEDRNTLIGQWEWPGGGYEAIMTRIK
jgi:hypothetical protein